MPEWTGAHRNEFYQCLAEGRIVDARAIIEPHLDLKLRDLKPVDRASLAAMSQAIARQPAPQRALSVMLCSPLQHVYVCGRMLFDHIEEFSGDLLAEALPALEQEIMDDLKFSVMKSWRKIPKGLSAAEQRKWAVEHYSAWEQKESGAPAPVESTIHDWLGPSSAMTNPMRERLLALVEVICLFPTAKSWSFLDEQFRGLICQRHGDRMRDPLRLAEERLTGENLSGYVQRTGLCETQAKGKQLEMASPALAPSQPTKHLSSKPSASARAAKPKKNDSPTPAAPLDPAQRESIVAMLGKLIQENDKAWDYMKKIPADGKKRMREALDLLTREQDPRIMLQIHQETSSVGAQYLLREYSRIMIDRYSRDTFFKLLDDLLQELTKEHALLSGKESNVAHSLRITLKNAALGAADELDPLFAISRREDNPQSFHYYTCGLDLDLATLPTRTQPEIRDFLGCWDVFTFQGNLDYEKKTWQMDAIRIFLDHPDYADLIAGRLATSLESGSALEINWAFRLAFEKPERLGALADSFVELTGRGLWQRKALDAVKAVRRLHALAEYGRCTPAEAAAAIEQAFTIEEPMLWRAAAEALKALKKKDSSIQLSDPDRVQELLARDPEKYGKFLKPLFS